MAAHKTRMKYCLMTWISTESTSMVTDCDHKYHDGGEGTGQDAVLDMHFVKCACGLLKNQIVQFRIPVVNFASKGFSTQTIIILNVKLSFLYAVVGVW